MFCHGDAADQCEGDCKFEMSEGEDVRVRGICTRLYMECRRAINMEVMVSVSAWLTSGIVQIDVRV